MKIKFLLSDLDGVIRMYPPERTASIEQRHGLQAGAILSIAFEVTLLTKAICGLITDEVWRCEIIKSLSKVYGEKTANAAIHEWSDFSGIIDLCYLQYVEVKFAGIPVAVLTNGTSRLKSDLAKLGIENRFLRIFNSAEIGVCKPNKKIYQHAVEQLGCMPSDILFVDDSLSHVQAASELGMITHHYKSFEDFEQFGRSE